MAYGNKYIISFSNDLNDFFEVYFDYLGYVGGSASLTADGSCITLRATTGDETKDTPIIGTECLINIAVGQTDTISIYELIATTDNYIRVTVYMDKNHTDPIFQGFIVVEDNGQPLIDPPFVLSLRALDNLGLLKGIYFLDTNGNEFTGKMSIIGWLSQILNQTGQTVNLRTYFNFYHSSFAKNQNPLEQTYLSCEAFESGSQTPAGDTNPADFNTGFIDYYDALLMIVKNMRCKLFQEAGRWHLVSLFEYINPNGYTWYEYSFGAPVAGIVPFQVVGKGILENYDVPVGKKEMISLINEDAMLYLRLATKSFELTYKYNQALNKICNQDLSQGNRNVTYDELISSALIDTTINGGIAINLTTQGYDAFCWTLFDGRIVNNSAINPYPRFQSLGKAFIRKVLDQLGYENERFLVITPNTVGEWPYVVNSNRVLIDAGDIFQMTLQFRTRVAATSNERYGVIYIHLYGDDGSFWSLNSLANGQIAQNPVVWQKMDSNFHNVNGIDQPCTSESIPDTTQWTDVEVNTNPLPGVALAKAPVSGEIEVILLYDLGVGLTEFWFKNITITILPFLQGSFQQLQGDYNYSLRNTNILQTFADTVDISDSPKRYFKGALVGAGAGYPILTPQWSRSGESDNLRFTQIMTMLLYAYFYRVFQKIEGSLRGMKWTDASLTVRPAGLLNSYLFIDTANVDKKYMLCSFDKDYSSGTWRGVFCETLANSGDIGFLTPDLFTFAYLFNSV